MAQTAGRLSCPRCGANNFESVSACWKCGAALSGASSMSAPLTMPPMASAPIERQPQQYSAPAYAGQQFAPAATGDSGVAKRAAIALALVIPWVGLPVGWVFMMIEDSRKQAVGRVCVVWSTIALVFHLLLMFAFAQS